MEIFENTEDFEKKSKNNWYGGMIRNLNTDHASYARREDGTKEAFVSFAEQRLTKGTNVNFVNQTKAKGSKRKQKKHLE